MRIGYVCFLCMHTCFYFTFVSLLFYFQVRWNKKVTLMSAARMDGYETKGKIRLVPPAQKIWWWCNVRTKKREKKAIASKVEKAYMPNNHIKSIVCVWGVYFSDMCIYHLFPAPYIVTFRNVLRVSVLSVWFCACVR